MGHFRLGKLAERIIQGWDDFEGWGYANEALLRQYLELRNGIPGHDTMRRVFEAMHEARGNQTVEIRYLIGSTAPDARAILDATRLHWGVENGLHRCLDVAFRKDARCAPARGGGQSGRVA